MCPMKRREVWNTLIWGKYESFMTCERSWKEPVMMACDATIAARIERTKLG